MIGRSLGVTVSSLQISMSRARVRLMECNSSRHLLSGLLKKGSVLYPHESMRAVAISLERISRGQRTLPREVQAFSRSPVNPCTKIILQTSAMMASLSYWTAFLLTRLIHPRGQKELRILEAKNYLPSQDHPRG